MNLNWIYTAVTWILLRWHDVFSFLEDRTFLATNWDWVLAIVFLVITVRIILFPLFVKQIKAQRAMQAIQPKLAELKEKHKGDRETLQKEIMELQRKEKANPLMGCLPMFLQIPVFISLFWILGRRMDPNRPIKVEEGQTSLPDSQIELYTWTFEQYESAANAMLFNAPIAAVFYEVGWFDRDMTGLYPEMGTNQLNVSLVAGVLTIIMVVTTFLTTRQMILKTGWATDPTQLMIQRLMVYGIPVMLLFSGAFFPIAVIIYWVINNLFSLGQQQWVLRKYPPPPQAAALAGAGGKPGGGKPGSSKAGGEAENRPAVDGKKLAPKPGAKPAQAKKTQKKAPQQGNSSKSNQHNKADGGQLDSANVPPKRPPSTNVPPKRKGPAPNGRPSSDQSQPPRSESRRKKE